MVSTLEEKHYRLALSLVSGIGSSRLKKLVDHFGTAQAVWKAAYYSHSVVPPNIARQIAMEANNKLSQAKEICQLHEAENIQLLIPGTLLFPKRLLELPDCPVLLYYQGNTLLNNKRIVSIVGTRQLSLYGQRMIVKFLEQLYPYQPLVVSGLAYGTDIKVHKEALAMGLPTIAVLPSSLENIYPVSHRQIAKKIVACNGGLLTEYPMGSGIRNYFFVARNRIVAGLSDVTVVIEAKEKSGALLTAYYANSYHREVFALPGNVDNATVAGCHQLIKRNQAHLLSHMDDLAYIMNWNVEAVPKRDRYATYALTPAEKLILAQYQQTSDPIAIDALLTATALPLGELHTALLSLELQGLLHALPGKRFTVARPLK
ncbi:MAG: DNA-processing protein DprA [Candidatus Cardinium sp.]|nr:DNA-processing protein DprA [Candidatus Cardinium sp.]